MTRNEKTTSHEDGSSVDRRRFMQAVGGAAVAGSVLLDSRFAHAAPATQTTAETAVQRLHASLSEKQTAAICFPFDHALRSRISANWHITKPTIGDDFYSKEQQTLITEIVKNVTSKEGYERLVKQCEDDDGGLDAYSIAIFGDPKTEQFQWELTGRHLTLRADGNRTDKTAFGGPLVYGHGESEPKFNLYHYQTKQVNKLFQALDEKQSKQALLKKAPGETAVKIQGDKGKFPGLAVSDLQGDQKELVEKTVKTLLDPYRPEDVEEVMQVLKAGGGVDKLHMAFYEQADLEKDQVWDIWRIEGPSFVWHFRGAPHVHAYINIAVT